MMRIKFFFYLLCLGILAGCGGGGTPPAPAFTYITHWSAPTGGIDGQSQLIELFDSNNIRQFTTTMDKPATSKKIFGVPNGTYHLHVELYSLPAEAGTLNGTLDTLVTVSGSMNFPTSVGPAVAHVKLSPTSATIQATHSQQFYATSEISNNTPTFTAPSGFNWQTLGGYASVDQNGLVIGNSAGSGGSVTAQNVNAGVTGAATLTVTANNTSQSKWTVIVFMNAANNLYPDSTTNMNQMASVAGLPANVRFVVQWKESTAVEPGSTFNSTRRILMDTSGGQIIQDLGPGYDMGSAANMLNFITWAKTNYPANRYCVIVWDHGKGWKRSVGAHQRGVSYDDDTGTHIDTWQLSQAFGNDVEDIVAWDSSLMQQLEVAEEVHNKATYIVGSEESPPSLGYPYHTIFAHFRDNPDATTLTLAKTFVDETLLFYGGANNITQSVIDTSQLSGLVTATNNLGNALVANVGSLGTIVPQVRATAQGYDDAVINGHYRDLDDVCLKLESLGAPAGVITAEQAVRTAVGQAIVYEGHNTNSPGSHGVSIDFSDSVSFTTSPPTPTLAQDYQNLRFGQETTWGSGWLSIAP